MSTDNWERGNNLGFIGTLTIAFIVLKLTHAIDWTWLWVLSPVWITVCVLALIVAVVAIVAAARAGK